MVLGALLDAGVKIEDLIAMLNTLGLKKYELRVERKISHGITGTDAIVDYDRHGNEERKLPDIIALIRKADLPEVVKHRSILIFQVLAEAESAVHGIGADQVHFHEVGGDDAIIDIVGTAAALYLLGVEKIFCSPLPLGRGEVKTAHGVLPLPAPATLAMCAQKRVPVYGKQADFELVTPTGVAIVTALAESFGPIPECNIFKVGYGSGKFDPGYPNFLRVYLGHIPKRTDGFTDRVIVINTVIDDMNPELYSYLFDLLNEAGALDVFVTPVQMKKNRPGVELTVISPPEIIDVIQQILFKETTTIGLRIQETSRALGVREIVVVNTKWGEIRVKYTKTAGSKDCVNYAPEYEDCRKIASLSGLPLKEVYRMAEELFRHR